MVCDKQQPITLSWCSRLVINLLELSRSILDCLLSVFCHWSCCFFFLKTFVFNCLFATNEAASSDWDRLLLFFLSVCLNVSAPKSSFRLCNNRSVNTAPSSVLNANTCCKLDNILGYKHGLGTPFPNEGHSTTHSHSESSFSCTSLVQTHTTTDDERGAAVTLISPLAEAGDCWVP